MNNFMKVESASDEATWSNWKNADTTPFSKPNSGISQNYYLFSYNYLPQILLNTNTPAQSSIFHGTSDHAASGNGNLPSDVIKLKPDTHKGNTTTNTATVSANENIPREHTVKCNPNMLLQVELNTPDSPLLPDLSNTTSHGFSKQPTNYTQTTDAAALGHNTKTKLPHFTEEKSFQKSTCSNSFKCTICDKEFEDENYVELHMAVHSQRGKSRQCDYCEQTFSSKGKWYTHFKTHFSDPSFHCVFCNSSFVTENYLQEHYSKVHSEKQLLGDVNFSVKYEDRNYPCTFCGKEFPDRSGIMFHLRIHTSDVVYRCSYCGKMFLNKSELNLHIRTHTGDKAHVCELCNKCFLTTSNLKQHFRTHTGDKPFCCTNCDKAFSNKSNLMQHMKVHTGEKPYHCKFCEKSFTTTSNLTQHLRTHTGVKPYVCAVCGKAFINNSNLSQHKKVHYSAAKKKDDDVCNGEAEKNP